MHNIIRIDKRMEGKTLIYISLFKSQYVDKKQRMEKVIWAAYLLNRWYLQFARGHI